MAQKVISNKILFWKISVIALGLISLSTGVLHFGDLWTSYLLDITGYSMGYCSGVLFFYIIDKWVLK